MYTTEYINNFNINLENKLKEKIKKENDEITIIFEQEKLLLIEFEKELIDLINEYTDKIPNINAIYYTLNQANSLKEFNNKKYELCKLYKLKYDSYNKTYDNCGIESGICRKSFYHKHYAQIYFHGYCQKCNYGVVTNRIDL